MPNPNLTFEGLPVREAKRGLKLHPIDRDKKSAKRGDPGCCVAAQCIKREQQVEQVRIYRTRALIKPKGKNHWVRYQMPPNLSLEALIFDRGGDFGGKAFILKPLDPSKRREAKRISNIKSEAKRKANSAMDGSRRKNVKSVMTELRGSPHFKRSVS